MNRNCCGSVRVAAFLTLLVALVFPSIRRHAATRAATCVINPVVTNNADSGAGSLRQAILDACDGSTITFAGVTSPITLASELDIAKNLTIQGPGANALTISGNNMVRVFNMGMIVGGRCVRRRAFGPDDNKRVEEFGPLCRSGRRHL